MQSAYSMTFSQTSVKSFHEHNPWGTIQKIGFVLRYCRNWILSQVTIKKYSLLLHNFASNIWKRIWCLKWNFWHFIEQGMSIRKVLFSGFLYPFICTTKVIQVLVVNFNICFSSTSLSRHHTGKISWSRDCGLKPQLVWNPRYVISHGYVRFEVTHCGIKPTKEDHLYFWGTSDSVFFLLTNLKYSIRWDTLGGFLSTDLQPVHVLQKV